VDVNQSEVDALVVWGYLSEEERDNGAAIKKAIEGVLSDLVFDLQSETAERSRARVWSVDPTKRVTGRRAIRQITRHCCDNGCIQRRHSSPRCFVPSEALR
jgi:hypothetical protein